MSVVYTVGHSTLSLQSFLTLLRTHGIETVVDIRRFPASRRFPHFHHDALQKTLSEAGIAYIWKKELGGRRSKTRSDSPNTALRVAAFRNYADHMLTPEFESAIADVVSEAGKRRTAIMCAEAVYFRCHRMLISDWLTAHGHTVLHIMEKSEPRLHHLTKEARIVGDKLIYPCEDRDDGRLF